MISRQLLASSMFAATVVSTEVRADTNGHRVDATAVVSPFGGVTCGSCDGYSTYKGLVGVGASAGYEYRFAQHFAAGTRFRYLLSFADDGPFHQRVATFDVPLLVSVPIAVGRTEIEPTLGVGWQHFILPEQASATGILAVASVAVLVRASERVLLRFAAGLEYGIAEVHSDNTYSNAHSLFSARIPIELGVRFAL